MTRFITKARDKLFLLDLITMFLGVTAAAMVATAVPQPYFWFAFPMYVVSACCAAVAAYKRKSYPMFILFLCYICIDSFGVYNWYPWS